LLTGAIPLFVTSMEYVTVSPTVAAVEAVLFTTATFGEETGNVSVFEVAVPVNVRPSGGVNV
jgi:hypothetical protein